MLTYTFSKREKALMVVLAVIVLAIIWFIFVYQGTAAQVQEYDAQIGTVRDEIAVAEARESRMVEMQNAISARKATNKRVVEVPQYDNLQNLTTEISRATASANQLSLSFDEVQFGDDGTVRRGVAADFACTTLTQAEAIISALSNGKFPCAVDSVSIDDKTGQVAAGMPAITAHIHLTYFERR